MTIACKIISLVLFFAIVAKGNCQCPKERLSVEQTKTGRTVKNLPEWKVVPRNTVQCALANVTLSCGDFQSVEPIDLSVLWKYGGECFINLGHPIARFSKFSFNYVWDSQFDLLPINCDPHCS